MITAGFAAEYGRFAGGLLTAVTKSGSNRLHGSLYEFIRNDLLDARGFFDVDKSKLRRHQFGARGVLEKERPRPGVDGLVHRLLAGERRQ